MLYDTQPHVIPCNIRHGTLVPPISQSTLRLYAEGELSTEWGQGSGYGNDRHSSEEYSTTPVVPSPDHSYDEAKDGRSYSARTTP